MKENLARGSSDSGRSLRCGCKATGKLLFHEFVHHVWCHYVAQILKCFNNKCPVSDLRENAEISERGRTQAIVTLPTPLPN